MSQEKEGTIVTVNVVNCNNITHGAVAIEENRLHIKYAINGTGKSTVAKATEYAASHDDSGLRSLTPYSSIGTTDATLLPHVDGLPEDVRIAVFNEEYVNQYVFMEDELVKNSFDIFVKTPRYEQLRDEINGLVSSIRSMFDNTPELESLLSDLSEFITCFGNNERTGISASGALAKGLSKGNLIRNIPAGLEEYSEFIQAEKNSSWLKWQATGREFMEISDKCPFCARDIAPQRDKIEQVKNEYDAKTVEHLSKILALFDRLGHYFSEETNENVRRITMSVTGLSTEQKSYLVQVKNDVEIVLKKLQALKRIGFDSLKDVDALAIEIEDKKIDLGFLPHLNTPFTADKVSIVNTAIDNLMTVVGNLQGAINRQKAEIRRTIDKYSEEINSFLRNAGYSYTVLIEEAADHSYKLKLRFGEEESTISGVKSHLSYGERNAFALVLFMYQAIYNQANLIVLDDPISSFDQNKKFAILDMLFIRGNSLRGRTVLMLTHDFEPVIDAIYNHPSFFDGTPKATFMENDFGELRETPITKDDIQSSIQVAKANIQSLDNGIIKAIYLRRLVEITEGKTAAWHLLSNLIHKRSIPVIGDDLMDAESVRIATDRIREDIDDFDYAVLCSYAQDDANLIALYDAAQSNYEKLQVYRMLFDPAHEDHVIRKFLNETYHIENDYLFQLNPIRYNTIPNYIIAECDRAIDGIRERG